MGERPWLKFYPSDWRGDPKLRMCSLAARGLWLEILTLMHEATPRGHLLINGIAPNATQLSALVGSPQDQVSVGLSELESVDVFSRTESGVIYSRRMTRDEKSASASRANGCLGGRPRNLKHNLNGNLKPKPQKSDTRGQIDKEKYCTKRKRVSYPSDFEDFWIGFPTDANMSKKEAFDEWIRLDDPDRVLAVKSLVSFVHYCKKDPDYRPIHACRYLKQRRFDGHAMQAEEVREKQKPSFKLFRGTPQYEAWNNYRESTGKPKILKDEWFFPTEWPPT